MADISLYIMATIYSLAGILHFIKPKPYMKIMPPVIPFPKMMVYISGFFELLYGIALRYEVTLSYAALGIVLLLSDLVGANICTYYRMHANDRTDLWLAFVSLPMQSVL